MDEKRQVSIYGRRLREAREAIDISQRALGIAVELDEFVASSRMNRYENGVNQPKLGLQLRLARALDLPLAYFYAEDDKLARLIANFGRKGKPRRGLRKTAKKRSKGIAPKKQAKKRRSPIKKARR